MGKILWRHYQLLITIKFFYEKKFYEKKFRNLKIRKNVKISFLILCGSCNMVF